MEAFRSRRLDHVEFPYAYLDASYLKVRNSAPQVASMAMVVAIGVTADSNREILGCDIGDSKSKGFRQHFLGSLCSASEFDAEIVRSNLPTLAASWVFREELSEMGENEIHRRGRPVPSVGARFRS